MMNIFHRVNKIEIRDNRHKLKPKLLIKEALIHYWPLSPLLGLQSSQAVHRGKAGRMISWCTYMFDSSSTSSYTQTCHRLTNSRRQQPSLRRAQKKHDISTNTLIQRKDTASSRNEKKGSKRKMKYINYYSDGKIVKKHDILWEKRREGKESSA